MDKTVEMYTWIDDPKKLNRKVMEKERKNKD